MNPDEMNLDERAKSLLLEDVRLELDLMEATLEELHSLVSDVAGRAPTARERAAAGAFLAQFYSGIENILKRICRLYGCKLPAGPEWHLELFEWFCAPSRPLLPTLFDEELARQVEPYRRFRHVVYHSYGIQLSWRKMQPGVVQSEEVFLSFQGRVLDYLDQIKG